MSPVEKFNFTASAVLKGPARAGRGSTTASNLRLASEATSGRE
jgi:hypothetical protein